MKVALAVDGSSCSLRATRFLIELLGRPEGTEVHVLNVQHPVPYVDLLPVEKQQLVEHWNRQSGNDETAAAREMLAAANVSCHLHVVVGDPATAIVKLARELGCDLIVMGTRGMSAVAGLALGSVVAKVIHLADTPVTLVK